MRLTGSSRGASASRAAHRRLAGTTGSMSRVPLHLSSRPQPRRPRSPRRNPGAGKRYTRRAAAPADSLPETRLRHAQRRLANPYSRRQRKPRSPCGYSYRYPPSAELKNCSQNSCVGLKVLMMQHMAMIAMTRIRAKLASRHLGPSRFAADRAPAVVAEVVLRVLADDDMDIGADDSILLST